MVELLLKFICWYLLLAPVEHPERTETLDLPEGATKPVSVGESISGSPASSVGSTGMFNSYISTRVYCEADFT